MSLIECIACASIYSRVNIMSFLQDPSEPDKIGMEGVVKFLEDLSLDPTSRLVGAIVTVSI